MPKAYRKCDSIVRPVKKEELAKSVQSQMAKPKNNAPTFGLHGLEVEKGDNARYLAIIMKCNQLPDVDLMQPEQVKQQIVDYFTICFENDFKPLISGLSSCLGLTRQDLLQLVTGNGRDADKYKYLPTLTTSYIKKAYYSMEQLWESYTQNGKLNPVSAIFLAKNNYRYSDRVDYTIQAKPIESDEDIANRYMLEDNIDEL